jgi:hypothetical protein
MKAHHRLPNGRTTFEVEGRSSKEIYEGLAEIIEIFEADSTCGCCKSSNLIPRVRTTGQYKFYELYCQGCSAALDFGQRKEDGRLFPKRRNPDGSELENRGWKTWRSRQDSEAKRKGNGPSADDVAF